MFAVSQFFNLRNNITQLVKFLLEKIYSEGLSEYLFKKINVTC